MKPSLIVTVDTEEEGLWGGRYCRSGNTVENIRHIPRFQSLCDRYGVRPTYLVDAAVLEHAWAVDILRAIQNDGRCEIGAHCHPWCNPPFEEELIPRNTYLCNLPEPLQRAKLTWLTERIEECFGHRPTSFRAGRYGLDITGARILAQLGYTVDSSVIPFTDYSASGGPNFNDAPNQPYYPNGESITVPAQSGDVLEVPVTVGYTRRNFRQAHRLRCLAAGTVFRHLRAVGILDRTGLARRIKCSPEQAGTRDLQRLVDLAAETSMSCIVLMFHSSSLLSGASPYVKTVAELEEFYNRLNTFFRHALQNRGLATTTASELALHYRQRPSFGSRHDAPKSERSVTGT